MTKEQKIRKALQYAKNLGIKIERGPCFDFTRPSHNGGIPISSGNKPSACNIYGALLLFLNVKESLSRLEDVKRYLQVQRHWLYRLDIGFNNLQQMIVQVKDKKTKKVHTYPDKVSILGIQLSKEFCK